MSGVRRSSSEILAEPWGEDLSSVPALPLKRILLIVSPSPHSFWPLAGCSQSSPHTPKVTPVSGHRVPGYTAQ